MGKEHYLAPIFATDGEGNEVTVAFGRDGTAKEGHTLISDGHKDDAEFEGEHEDRGHDHYNGIGGGTTRGQYTGVGS